jgi:peptidoglycan/xylan/chitin deacetylase (PgdA/CDA1 family)
MIRLKAVVKDLAGHVCEGPWFKGRITRTSQNSINVVYYHYVGDTSPHYDSFYCGCTITKFRDDLLRLSRIFVFAPLNEVLAAGSVRSVNDRPKMAITFDDGLDLRNTGAMEVMDSFKIKATNFLITSCLNNRQMMWRHMLSAVNSLASRHIWSVQYNRLALECGFPKLRKGQSLMEASSFWKMPCKDEWAMALWEACGLPSLEDYLGVRQPYLDDSGLKEWIAAGHSLGFHTHTHPFCSRLEFKDLESEFLTPATELKAKFNLDQLYLSYPFGNRLSPDLESKISGSGLFKGIFGINGFSPNSTPRDKLERVGIEGANIGWSVFANRVMG